MLDKDEDGENMVAARVYDLMIWHLKSHGKNEKCGFYEFLQSRGLAFLFSLNYA